MTSSRLLKVLIVAGAAVACGGPAEQAGPGAAGSPAGSAAVAASTTVQRITPVLVVDAIEPSLPFWEALGFTVSSPTWIDDKLIFAGVSKDGLDLHYHTRANLERNAAETADMLTDTTSLVYVTVANLDPIIAGLGDAEVVIPRRRTNWGSDEIYVREPGGNIVAFAAFGR